MGCRCHVPLLPRDLGRAASDARPRQQLASRAVGAARARRPHLRGDARDHGALHLLQGLQARMPDRRRYGADEDRVPASISQGEGAQPARAADRLFAALCARGIAVGIFIESARPRAGPGDAERDPHRLQRAARATALERQALCRAARRWRGARGRALRRYLQPLVRTGECARRRARAAPRRI